jgi:hypothetical protein
VEKQGIQLKFDRNQLFPELDLIGTYGYNGAGRNSATRSTSSTKAPAILQLRRATFHPAQQRRARNTIQGRQGDVAATPAASSNSLNKTSWWRLTTP